MRFFCFPKEIIFTAYSDVVTDTQTPPVPSSKVIPDWYKKLSKFKNVNNLKSTRKRDLKSCSPFKDAFVSGYMILLMCDIEIVSYENGDVDVLWNKEFPSNPVEKRGPLIEGFQGNGMINPIGTSPIMFAWSASWGVKTSKNDNVLITHPLNHYELPFVTTSGVIDSGYFPIAGNIPFFIKEGFTGVIAKGTPIAQVIPFKRQDWVSSVAAKDEKMYSRYMTLRDSYFDGYYAKFLRQSRLFK